MSRRKQRWIARFTLLSLTVLVVSGVVWGGSSVRVRHSHQFWPYGHVHNLLEGIGVVCSYVVVISAASFVILLLGIGIYEGISKLWRMAWN